MVYHGIEPYYIIIIKKDYKNVIRNNKIKEVNQFVLSIPINIIL